MGAAARLRMRARAAGGAAIGALAAFAVGVAACGGADEPAYCADREALEQSLAGLADVDVRTGGIGALTDQLDEVERDASALVDSARDEFGDEAAALRSAIARFESSARATLADPSAADAAELQADAADVTVAFEALSDAVESSC